MQFSKLIVALIICLNLGFTVAVLYVFLRVGSEPTALIAAWFAFTTGELWLLSGIKREKLRRDGFGENHQRDKYPV
jgi:hypothetical protein